MTHAQEIRNAHGFIVARVSMNKDTWKIVSIDFMTLKEKVLKTGKTKNCEVRIQEWPIQVQVAILELHKQFI